MQRLNNIVESMQRWYRSLDQYTLTFTKQLFEENEVFEILSDCYESVQLDGDGEILNDIDALLRNNGATIE